MSVVLDCSVALAWVYADEGTDATDRILDRVSESGAWVPAIWRLEVANSLEQAVRRGRIAATTRDAALADLSFLDISIDLETNLHAWTTTVALASRFRLTTYDAAYLEVASRRGLPLASLDNGLAAAADGIGIVVLGR